MAKYIGYITDPNYDDSNCKQSNGARCPYFRRTFFVNKPVKRVTVNVAAYGIFRAYINGTLVSEEVFASGWSDYHYTVYYRMYDVTTLVKEGVNAFGAIVGDGWYASNLSDVGRFVFGGYPLKLRYEVDVTYEDGTHEKYKADGTEKASVGAYMACDNQNGMIIDAREDCGDFSAPDFDDSKWSPVEVYEGLKPRKANFEPIMPHEPLCATVCARNGNTVTYDFKQNFAGVVRAKFKGKSGDKIVFRHGELMIGDGVYVDNLRSAEATDTFILSGKGEEAFYPVFTYHGFRYAELTLSEGVEILSIEGVPFYSDCKETSTFECANPIVNQLYKNILWGQRSNFFSVPTDCPQRDERLGWTGDAQLFLDTAAYNMDVKRFYAKFLADAEDTMLDGKPDIPVVLPYLFDYVPYDKLHIGYPGWSDCVITIAYRLYLVYGNKSILLEHLPLMKKHIEYMLTLCDDYIPTRNYCHGDWLSVGETTDKTVYSTLYLAYATDLLAKICRIVGDSEEWYYIDLCLKIRRAFKEKFVGNDGRIESDTQCAYILAYAFGVLSATDVKEHLKRKFEQFDGHLVTGFHGTKFSLHVLCELGLKEIAYKLVTNTSYPSWGYSIVNGATTIWERWNGYEEGNLHVDKMNSFNHFVFGSIGHWFFEGMLGFSPTEEGAGFQKIRVRPYLDKQIGWAKGSYESESGKISAAYRYDEEGFFRYTITLPETVTANFDFETEVLESSEQAGDGFKTYDFRLKA